MLKENNSYSKQWATIFILFYGPNTIKEDAVTKLLYPILSKDWELKEKPILFSASYPQVRQKFTTGPWKKRDTTNLGPILTSVKWNIRKLNSSPVTDVDLGNIRSNYREKIVPLLSKVGLGNEYIAARNYGTPFDKLVDKNLPKNPPIPPEPKIKWWLWAIGGVAGLLVIKQAFNRKSST